MPRQLIIRVLPDDRVEVQVEGFTETDRDRPADRKLCRKLTERLERDIGRVETRLDCAESKSQILLSDERPLELEQT
jgi:hypothetical protein